MNSAVKKIIYTLRWIVAGIVYLPFQYMNFNPFAVILFGSLLGAIIFWHIDKRLTR